MTGTYIFEELRLPAELYAAALLFLIPFAEKRSNFRIRAAAGYAAGMLLSLLYFAVFGSKDAPRLQFLTAVWYSALAFTPVLYARLCFVIGWCDALFLSIAAFSAQNIVYNFYHLYLGRVLVPALRLYLPIYISGAVLACALLYYPLYRLFSPELRENDGGLFEDRPSTLFFYLFLFSVMMMSLFFYQAAFDHRISFYDGMAWLSGIVVSGFLLLVQYSMLRGIRRTRQQAVLENMLRGSEHYYELSKEQIAIINRKCHDLKHQLRALEMADDSERKAFIREAQDSVLFYQQLVYTDNEALNTILAEKGLICREKGIEFHCAVDDADLSFIRLTDLYAILGNAIDNAIEYVQQQEDPKMRSISLRIAPRNRFVGIQVTNPYAGEPLSSEALPGTHKADKAQHGFGMRSIRYLAEKYGGMMEFSAGDGLFTLQIVLPV